MPPTSRRSTKHGGKSKSIIARSNKYAALDKSPTRTVTTQTNHFFAALCSFVKPRVAAYPNQTQPLCARSQKSISRRCTRPFKPCRPWSRFAWLKPHPLRNMSSSTIEMFGQSLVKGGISWRKRGLGFSSLELGSNRAVLIFSTSSCLGIAFSVISPLSPARVDMEVNVKDILSSGRLIRLRYIHTLTP